MKSSRNDERRGDGSRERAGRVPLPEQHHRVRAPRPPGVRAPLEVARAEIAGRAAKDQIGRQKRVGLVERAHRDVGGRPVADAGNRGERGMGAGHAVGGIEANVARHRPAGPARESSRRVTASRRPPRAVPGRVRLPTETAGSIRPVLRRRCPTASRLVRRASLRPGLRSVDRESRARPARSRPTLRACECPACAASGRASSGSFPRCAAITAGSALTSNIRRTRSTMESSARGPGNFTSSDNAPGASIHETSISPLCPSICSVRR